MQTPTPVSGPRDLEPLLIIIRISIKVCQLPWRGCLHATSMVLGSVDECRRRRCGRRSRGRHVGADGTVGRGDDHRHARGGRWYSRRRASPGPRHACTFLPRRRPTYRSPGSGCFGSVGGRLRPAAEHQHPGSGDRAQRAHYASRGRRTDSAGALFGTVGLLLPHCRSNGVVRSPQGSLGDHPRPLYDRWRVQHDFDAGPGDRWCGRCVRRDGPARYGSLARHLRWNRFQRVSATCWRPDWWISDGFQSIDRSRNDTGLDVRDYTVKFALSPPESPHRVELKLQFADQVSNQSYLV